MRRYKSCNLKFLMPSLDRSPQRQLHSNKPLGSLRFRLSSSPGLIAILMLMAVLPYVNALHNGFVYDDTTQVLNNPYIQNFRHLPEIFSTNVWSYRGGFRGVSNYYRPMMTLGYLAVHQLFGSNPLAFHAVNLLLHALVVSLVFVAGRQLFLSGEIGFFAATVFALHPVHTEPVNWIGAVTELELTLFYLLTFWFFLVLPKPGSWRLVLAHIGMAGSFTLAMLSKEQAVTLPLVAMFYEHLYRSDRQQTTLIQKISRYGALWLLLTGYFALRISLLGKLVSSSLDRNFSIVEIFISSLALIAQYVGKLIWPAHLCVYYLFGENVGVLTPWAIAGLGVLAVFGLVFRAVWKHDRIATFGVVWFLLTLGPVLNVTWMPKNAFAERYVYLPSVGFCWLLGWMATVWWTSLSSRRMIWRPVMAIAACVILAFYVARIVTRNREWHDDIALYKSTLRVSPDSADMHNNLGMAYWVREDIPAAEREWNEALRLEAENAVILHNLGLVAKREKRYEDAVGYFLRALQVVANYADAHLDLGLTYGEMGLRPQAELQLRAAVALAPLMVRARNALGEFYFDERQIPQAEEQFRISIETEPTREAYWDLGFIDWMKGDRAGAERAFKHAEALLPSSSRAHFILGLFYAETGRTAEAVREYRVGLEYDPTNAEALTALQKLDPQAPHRATSRP